MGAFAATPGIPNPAYDAQRGGGHAAIIIPVLDDYSDEAASAAWEVLSLFTNKQYDRAPKGGQSDDLDVSLIDQSVITIEGATGEVQTLTQSITFTTLRAEDAFEFLDSANGVKYFLADLYRRYGDTKVVRFAYGIFDQTISESKDPGSPGSVQLKFNIKSHGLAAADITIPTLPVNTDPEFSTTDNTIKKYIGWLLAAADSAKGGFGTAVAVPTASQLHATKGMVQLKF